MLSSSLYTMVKLSETTSPWILFLSDCITLYHDIDEDNNDNSVDGDSSFLQLWQQFMCYQVNDDDDDNIYVIDIDEDYDDINVDGDSSFLQLWKSFMFYQVNDDDYDNDDNNDSDDEGVTLTIIHLHSCNNDDYDVKINVDIMLIFLC